MGFFWKTIACLGKQGLYFGKIYTIGAYLYNLQIKYRLGDVEECLKMSFDSLPEGTGTEFKNRDYFYYSITMGIISMYQRTWNYRQYEQNCKEFNEKVIQPILKSYEEAGIFRDISSIQKQIADEEDLNWGLCFKILNIREIHNQKLQMYRELIQNLFDSQQRMMTRKIMNLSGTNKKKMELIYDYLSKFEYLAFRNKREYFEFKKKFNEDTKRFRSSEVLFKINFI